jgi:hypothetical protein
MTKIATLPGLVALSMMAGLATAADKPAGATSAESGAPAKHASHKRFDPVRQTQQRLDRLEGKLSLKEDQKTAWKTYYDAAVSRAQDRSAKLQALRDRKGEPRKEADTASRLEKSAEMMRARADQLEKIAQDTRAFQQVLTPEQQTIFDLYWKSQPRHGRMGGPRPA